MGTIEPAGSDLPSTRSALTRGRAMRSFAYPHAHRGLTRSRRRAGRLGYHSAWMTGHGDPARPAPNATSRGGGRRPARGALAFSPMPPSNSHDELRWSSQRSTPTSTTYTRSRRAPRDQPPAKPDAAA
jgi:hypothetical protein